MDSEEEQIMCSPIPGTDLEIVVRRIREISRRMDTEDPGATQA